jgi:sulfatase maturation enzyme AslB (radical SAM superfamily)
MIQNAFFKLYGISSPIFRYNATEWCLFYAPGTLVRVIASQANAYENHLRSRYDDDHFPYLKDLRRSAMRAEKLYQKKLNAHFEPLSLNLYLNQKCNLNCVYCFSDLPEAVNRQLSVPAIQAAAKIVAANCARHTQPFTVVFHGGGEPVLSWEIIDQVQPYLQELAAQKGIPLFRYIATNGVMSAERARWLAESFDLVGLSCDGSPEIQSVQRPMRGAHAESTPILERTARILKKAGKPVHVRVTITAATVDQQAAICRYICETLTPQEIHVEPVYQNARAHPSLYLTPAHLERFLSAYFEAQAIAAGYGVDWKMSGSRLHEIHAAHCNILRQVLNLVPGEAATACFKLVSAEQAKEADLSIGRFDPGSQIFVLNTRHIHHLRIHYTHPKACEACLILHQCSHNCPNACPLLNQPADEAVGGDLLCRLLRQAATQQLIRLSGMLEVGLSHPVARLNLTLS